MNLPRLALFFVLGMLAPCLSASPAASAQAAALSDHGDFKGAAILLTEALKKTSLPPAARQKLAFQLDMLNRIKLDYSFTKDDLFKALSRNIRDLTPAEFDRWVGEGRFDSKTIDGQTWYVNTDALNIFFRNPELGSRRLDGKEDSQKQRARLELSRTIRKAAHQQHTPYVLPHRFLCTMIVAADNGAAPPGEIVRAWLPIPRQYPFQTQFKLINTSSPVKALAPETSPIRSVCLEQSASEEGSARFEITYSYTMSGIYFEMDPTKIQPADLRDPELKKYTREGPHVTFTQEIREMADKIAGSETNPMLVARSFYDWIGSNIKYSYAREYSTLTNIGDYCLTHRYGDCGQEAMLFITLCREKGIPARWQSGWNIFPGATANHDWSEIYLAPYGWVPVDACKGMAAMRYAAVLSPSERRELHDFYFGGLDYYRMTANSDHSQLLDPPKESPRSDDVDFQRGELEYGQTNIYFNNFHCALHVKELK